MTQLEVVIDREAVARYGINIADVNELLETGVAGKVATRLIEGQRRFAVVVRFPEEARARHRGDRAAARPRAGRRAGAARADRRRSRSSRRRPRSAARTACGGSSSRPTCAAATSAASSRRCRGASRRSRGELPPGYFVEYGGQFENQQRAMRQLAIVVPVVARCSSSSCSTWRSARREERAARAREPAVRPGRRRRRGGASFRMPLSVSAAVAFIVLLGIAVQNGVVLVAFFRQLRERGAHGRGDGARGLRPAVQAAVHDRADQLHRPAAAALRHRLGRRHPAAARRRSSWAGSSPRRC